MSDTQQAAMLVWRRLIHADPCLTDEQSIEVIRLAIHEAEQRGEQRGMERAAGIVNDEKVDAAATGEEGDKAYNQACDDITQAIRAAKETR